MPTNKHVIAKIFYNKKYDPDNLEICTILNEPLNYGVNFERDCGPDSLSQEKANNPFILYLEA